MNTTKKYIKLLLLLLFSSNIFAQKIELAVQKFVDSTYAADPKAVGFALYVEAPDQHLSFSYAVGYSDRETKQKLTADQPVLIASTTKPYLAATILRLVEKGRLDINQPLKNILLQNLIRYYQLLAIIRIASP